jgi:hypothetical protein
MRYGRQIDGLTDGWTDGPTDQQMDGHSLLKICWAHLKTMRECRGGATSEFVRRPTI